MTRFPGRAWQARWAETKAWIALVPGARDDIRRAQIEDRTGAAACADRMRIPAAVPDPVLSLPARLVRHARDRVLKISRTWPWKDAFLTCWRRLSALPAPA